MTDIELLKNIQDRFDDVFYQKVYHQTWFDMFNRKYQNYVDFLATGCRVCATNEPLTDFCGYISPAVHLPTLPVCNACKSDLEQKQALFSQQTAIFQLTLFANLRNEIIDALISIDTREPDESDIAQNLGNIIISLLREDKLTKRNKTTN